jgi:hypothetical protein
MILTKRQFCEKVLRDYYGGDVSADRDRDPREILLMFYELVPFFAKQNFFDNNNVDALSYVDGQLITTQVYNQILFDRDFKEKYIELQALPAALPKGYGIHEVRALNGSYTMPFVLMRNGDNLFSSLPGGGLKNKCYLEGSKIKFKNLANDVSKIGVKLVGAVDINLDMDSPVGIAGEYLDQAYEKVLARLRAADQDNKDDTINDGNED